MVVRELSFSRLECGVHDRLHIYPLCGIFYFPWHSHQIEGTNGFYCLIRKTERFTISNVESQVFTPNNSRLDPGSNSGCPRDKSYHWTNCTIRCRLVVMSKNRPDVSKIGAARLSAALREATCSKVEMGHARVTKILTFFGVTSNESDTSRVHS